VGHARDLDPLHEPRVELPDLHALMDAVQADAADEQE
jgi:hypothetical protein